MPVDAGGGWLIFMLPQSRRPNPAAGAWKTERTHLAGDLLGRGWGERIPGGREVRLMAEIAVASACDAHHSPSVT